jgi:excisionase family DNA binding protein
VSATAAALQPGVYTVQEAAALLGVSDWTVYRMIREREHPFDGTVRVFQLGRAKKIPRADLDRHLSGQPAHA